MTSSYWERLIMSDNRLIPIYTLANRFEADLLMDALHREDIPAILRSFEETAYDGLFVPQRGWGQILVPEEYVPAAHEIIAPLIQELQSDGFADDSREGRPFVWEEPVKVDT
jgi:hypothetical protein